MSAQIIPLANAPNQTLSVQLTVNNQSLVLQLVISYSAMAGYWSLAVSSVTGALLIASVPLITGWYPAANLLAQYQYMQIGSAYLLNTGGASSDYPNSTNLEQFTLLWDDNTP